MPSTTLQHRGPPVCSQPSGQHCLHVCHRGCVFFSTRACSVLSAPEVWTDVCVLAQQDGLFFPKFNHSSSLPVCIRFVIFTYEACACACASLYFVMSSVGFLTPWDWSDPELSYLCLSSTCACSNTHTRKTQTM